MPKFRKSILPAGTYLVTTPMGTREAKLFDKGYLKTVVENTNKMIESGLRIPAPFKHLKEAVPVSSDIETSSFDNAGYWDSFELAEENGNSVLVGIIDAPGESDNMSTPAGKLQNTIKEVSACIKDKWQDGLGRNWGPCILHGAPVIHPVVPGQDGFSLMHNTYALSASGLIDSVEQEDSVSIGELSTLLKDVVNVFLPTNIEPSKLASMLKVALLQYKLCQDDEEADSEVVETQSLFMSLQEGQKMPISKAAAEELVKLGGINPKTQKPFTLEDFEISDKDPTREYALALTRQVVDDRKSILRSRIDNLVATGRTTKEHAEKALYPEIDKYELSIGENAQFQKNVIEYVVDSLEAMPSNKVAPSTNSTYNMSNGVPNGMDVHNDNNPDPSNIQLSEEESKAMLQAMLSMV